MSVLVSQILFWTCAAACAVAQFYIIVRAVVRPGMLMHLDDSPHVSNSTIPPRRQSGRLQELFWVLLPAGFLAAVFVFAWGKLPR